MSATTNIATGDLVTFEIKIKGNTISETYDVKDIHVEKAVNRISTAKITIIDGSSSTGTFTASSSEDFVPGNDVTIEVGYESKNNQIFKGIITKQTINIDRTLGSVLIVECKDEAVKMIVGRKTAAFQKQKDSDIISSIIGNYSGLSADVSSTTTQWEEQLQYYTTDWDFVLARAEANGFIVTNIDNKVAVFPPDKNTSAVLEIEYGNNLIEFNADLDAVSQIGSVKATAWDFTQQKVVTGEESNSYSGPGNLSAKKLSEVVGLDEYDLQSTVPLESSDLTNWSKAQLVKNNYAKIRGDMKFQGSNLVDPGKYLTLAGLGDRFNGDHFVSGVMHDISQGNWVTEATVGMSTNWFTEEPDVMAPPASGLLPGVQGLYNGTVKKMYEDPDSQYRIQVDVPLLDPKGDGIWARLATFYATSGAGAFFLPEVGDEVVLGFLNEDPRFPIILGSMYSSTNNKPFNGLDPDEKNSKKAIVSKSGIYIQFDDENKVLTIETPQSNVITLSDEAKQISLKDQNGNSIVMSESGIEIKSPKQISITADQSVSVKGTQGVTVEASPGDVSVKGMNVSIKADTQLSAEGSATAEFKGGAQASLKAAMVMIN